MARLRILHGAATSSATSVTCMGQGQAALRAGCQMAEGNRLSVWRDFCACNPIPSAELLPRALLAPLPRRAANSSCGKFGRGGNNGK